MKHRNRAFCLLYDYQVILAGTCSLAKTLYASCKPDLVILDLGLPDMEGMHFSEYVRKDSLTPIIVLSARADSAIIKAIWRVF